MSALLERLKALLPISEALASQDNRCTDQPTFLVRQTKREEAGPNCDPDGAEWRNEDWEPVETEEAARLEAAYEAGEEPLHCPFGKQGDRLWVKETWSDTLCDDIALYRADSNRDPVHGQHCRARCRSHLLHLPR